jgi:hypothetical protein
LALDQQLLKILSSLTLVLNENKVHLFRVGGLFCQVGDDVGSRQGLELEHHHLARLKRVQQVDLQKVENQGCKIFLGQFYQNVENIPNDDKFTKKDSA